MEPKAKTIEVAVIKAPPGADLSGGRPLVVGPDFTIGRSSECDLCLQHATVSRRHAQLIVDDGGITLQQLSPRGTTYVHSQKVREGARVSLAMPEDFVQVGALVLAVREQSNTITYSHQLDIPAVAAESYLMVAGLGESAYIVEVDGAPIHMARAPARALIALAESPGEIVSTHRLLHSVDPMYERYGGGNVNQLVTYARNAFVDACDEGSVDLETLRDHVLSAVGSERASRWDDTDGARGVARLLIENVRGRGYLLNLKPEQVTVRLR